MTPEQQAAMKLALKAMESFQNGTSGLYEGEFEEEITALRQALEPQTRPATRDEKIVNPGVYEAKVEHVAWIDRMTIGSTNELIRPQPAERLELIGHADLAINNIYIFNGYGEEVPEGRTPIYAGYKEQPCSKQN